MILENKLSPLLLNSIQIIVLLKILILLQQNIDFLLSLAILPRSNLFTCTTHSLSFTKWGELGEFMVCIRYETIQRQDWASLVVQTLLSEPTCNVGDLGLRPGLGRFPGRGHGSSLQYSCLENSHRQMVASESDTTEQLSTAHSTETGVYAS